MKLFLSADIEGCAGLAMPAETHKTESVYRSYAEEMTKEVVAACEAAPSENAGICDADSRKERTPV